MSRISLAPLALIGAAAGLLAAGCGGGGGGGGSNPNPAVTQSVTGFVFDADTAAPVGGASVKIQGTNIAVTTNVGDGSYTVGPLNPSRSYNVLISAPGYVDSVVKMLSKSGTLQGPQVILTKGNPPQAVNNTTGGAVTSNQTLDGNTATVTVPANALPGGVTTASVGATLLVGTAVPGASPDNSKIAYPALNVNVSGATGNFTQPVKLTFPLPFTLTAGAQLTVAKLGSDGNWAPVTGTATVSTDGKSASFDTTTPGTYSLLLSLKATATQAGAPDIQNIAGPYTDPVTVPLTGTTINWSVQGQDTRDALDSSFTQGQRQGDIAYPGDLDATQLVIHPRGTSLIQVVKNNLNVTVTGSGFTIQQTGSSTNGTVNGLASFQIVAHSQGGGGAN